MLEHRPVDGVEKRLGYLEIVVTFNQPGINTPGITPEIEVVQVFTGNQLHVFIDAGGMRLVQVYALRRCLLDTVPVGVFKPGLCREGNVLELGEVGLEAVEYRSRKALFPFFATVNYTNSRKCCNTSVN